MAIANGTCVSFCNQPKAHFGLPWVRPCDNRGKCHMDEKMIQCLANALQHPSIFNRFAVIQPVSSKVRHFSTCFAHFGLSWVRPWDNRGIVIWMERGFNAGQTHRGIPIYLQPFTSYSEILVGNCNFFIPLAFNAPVEGVPIGIPGKSLILRKLGSEDSLTI